MPLAHVAPVPHGLDWLAAWTFSPYQIALLVIGVEVYVWLYRRVPNFPVRRLVYFIAGTVALALALMSPIGTYDDTLLWDHMIQHLDMTYLAAPLFALSAPVTLALRAANPQVRRVLAGVLNSAPLRFLVHPATAWVLFVGAMWGTHFSPVYEAAVTNDTIHSAEHALYVVSAYLFWRPVVAVDPHSNRLSYGARVAYLFVTMAPMAFLGLAVYSAGHVLYPAYAAAHPGWGPNAIDDQRIAGAIMWVEGGFDLIGGIMIASWAWMRSDVRSAARRDASLPRLLDRLESDPAFDALPADRRRYLSEWVAGADSGRQRRKRMKVVERLARSARSAPQRTGPSDERAATREQSSA